MEEIFLKAALEKDIKLRVRRVEQRYRPNKTSVIHVLCSFHLQKLIQKTLSDGPATSSDDENGGIERSQQSSTAADRNKHKSLAHDVSLFEPDESDDMAVTFYFAETNDKEKYVSFYISCFCILFFISPKCGQLWVSEG